MKHNLKNILTFALIAVVAQGCTTYPPTVAENRQASFNEVFETSFAELEQCSQVVTQQHPAPSLQNVIWRSAAFNAIPISYRTNKQQLNKTQKTEFTALEDANSDCLARYGEQLAAAHRHLKLIEDLYIDRRMKITIALLQDRINIGQYHEDMKQLAATYEAAQNMVIQGFEAELALQHQNEWRQRNLNRDWIPYIPVYYVTDAMLTKLFDDSAASSASGAASS